MGKLSANRKADTTHREELLRRLERITELPLLPPPAFAAHLYLRLPGMGGHETAGEGGRRAPPGIIAAAKQIKEDW